MCKLFDSEVPMDAIRIRLTIQFDSIRLVFFWWIRALHQKKGF